MAAGIKLKDLMLGHEQILFRILGTYVIIYSIARLYWLNRKNKDPRNNINERQKGKAESFIMLAAAGIFHGMFVCGGPLLTGYLTGRLTDKTEFRATVSTMWIILNGFIFADDIRMGLWTPELIRTELICIPIFGISMVIGTWMYKKMDQHFFTLLTYILLCISGTALFFK